MNSGFIALWLRSLELQQPLLRVETAIGREPPELAAGCQHAVAGNEDRERILAERLTDGG